MMAMPIHYTVDFVRALNGQGSIIPPQLLVKVVAFR